MAGFHQYDAQLEDFSRKNIDAEIAALKTFEKRIEAIHPDDSRADFVPRTDREIVLNNIRSQLLDARNHPPLGKERRQLLEHLRQRRLHAHGAQIRARPTTACARSSPAKNRCPRFSPPPARTSRTRRTSTPRSPSSNCPDIISFFQNDVPQAFADAHDPALKAEFAKPTPPSIAASQRVISTGSRPTCSPAPMATSASAPTPSRRNFSTTRWSICLSTSCSRSAGPICARIRTTSSKSPNELEPDKDPARGARRARRRSPRARSAPRRLPRHVRRPGRLHSRRTTSSPSRPTCAPSSKRRRPSCAPQPSPPWIRRAPSKPTPPKPTSTSRCPTHP